jgi:hypothetical protein
MVDRAHFIMIQEHNMWYEYLLHKILQLAHAFYSCCHIVLQPDILFLFLYTCQFAICIYFNYEELSNFV